MLLFLKKIKNLKIRILFSTFCKMLKCTLTGQTPINPVLTPRGIVYEKNSIEEYLKTSNTCPFDNLPLNISELIPIQISTSNIHPSIIRANSFQDLLTSLQTEWNITQEELFQLKKKLAQCQKELALALYEKEAAKRVIARLISEKNLNINEKIIIPPNQEKINLSNFLLKTAKTLLNSRKPTLNSSIELSKSIFEAFKSFKTKKINSFLNNSIKFTAIDKFPNSDVLIGTSDGIILIFNINELKIKYQIQVFNNSIISILSTLNHEKFLTACIDGNISIYNFENLDIPEITLNTNKEIISAIWHPSYLYIYIFFKNGSWNLIDSKTLLPLDGYNFDDHYFSYSDMHPDGNLLATSLLNTGKLLLWNVSSNDKLIKDSNFELNGIINLISMSPSGLFIAAASNNEVKIWLTTNPSFNQTINLNVTSICWDTNGFNLIITNEEKSTMFLLILNDKNSFYINNHIDLSISGNFLRFSENSNYLISLNNNEINLFTS